MSGPSQHQVVVFDERLYPAARIMLANPLVLEPLDEGHGVGICGAMYFGGGTSLVGIPRLKSLKVTFAKDRFVSFFASTDTQ
jgi:hypothetical protein